MKLIAEIKLSLLKRKVHGNLKENKNNKKEEK